MSPKTHGHPMLGSAPHTITWWGKNLASQVNEREFHYGSAFNQLQRTRNISLVTLKGGCVGKNPTFWEIYNLCYQAVVRGPQLYCHLKPLVLAKYLVKLTNYIHTDCMIDTCVEWVGPTPGKGVDHHVGSHMTPKDLTCHYHESRNPLRGPSDRLNNR